MWRHTRNMYITSLDLTTHHILTSYHNVSYYLTSKKTHTHTHNTRNTHTHNTHNTHKKTTTNHFLSVSLSLSRTRTHATSPPFFVPPVGKATIETRFPEKRQKHQEDTDQNQGRHAITSTHAQAHKPRDTSRRTARLATPRTQGITPNKRNNHHKRKKTSQKVLPRPPPPYKNNNKASRQKRKNRST